MDAGSSAEASIAVLLEVQKADGGWGYYAESESRIEPTCWALSALSSAQDFKRSSAALTNARRFLLAHQDKQGFWTATPGMDIGNWVTSLACAVLSSDAEAESATQAGLSWLCSDYPLDSSPAVRFFRRLLSRTNTGEQDEASRGWGWTPRTSSWVEPTAFALLAMQQFPENRLPAAAATRRELAVALLYERMCPDGGWNSGNPRVYGVAGEALVLPTAWALLALALFPSRKANRAVSRGWKRLYLGFRAPRLWRSRACASRPMIGSCRPLSSICAHVARKVCWRMARTSLPGQVSPRIPIENGPHPREE
jgi:hypothetical protein